MRSILVAGYESGVYLERNFRVHSENDSLLGYSPLMLTIGGVPRISVRAVKSLEKQGRGFKIEYAFSSSIVELYSLYWHYKLWPMYGVITDIND